MLDAGKPVAFGVLTCENEQQAFERSGEGADEQGRRSRADALEMLSLLEEIRR